jgi:hypothetical protein
MLTLLNFGQFLKIPNIVSKSSASIFHAAKSSQMPYTPKNNKIGNFVNKIKNPLEPRLANALQALKESR